MDKKKQNEKLMKKIISDTPTAEDLAELKDICKSEDHYKQVLLLMKEMSRLKAGLDWKTISETAEKLAGLIFDDFSNSRSAKKSDYGIRTYDSKVMPIPQGIRPAAVDTRLLKYVFKSFKLEMSAYPISLETNELIGRIVNTEYKDSLSVCIKCSDKTQISEIDHLGLFRFESVNSGKLIVQVLYKKKIIGQIDIEL